LFILLTSIAPAITFGLYLSQSTNNELGAIEVLLSMSIVGILFSLFAGQPLVIVGVTGPTAFLTASIYTIAKAFGLPFIPFYACSQLWAALMHMIMGVCNLCDLVSLVTRYSCETFGILIALIYLYTGLDGIATMFTDTKNSLASSLLQFIIAIGTVLTAICLSNAKYWSLFTNSIRLIIADYGPSIAVIAWSTVPYMHDDNVPTLYVPLDFKTTSGRPWLVDLGGIPVWGVFAAIFPGLIITILFFFDHNVSSLIAQDRLFKLQKGSAYHWDFFMLGVGLILSGVLGLPPNNGLIPQAPLHVKSLMVEVEVEVPRRGEVHTLQSQPQEKEKEFIVLEQRWTILFQSIGCGLLAIYPFAVALRLIPTAVLYGLFLFLGLASFEDNEFARRMYLLIMDRSLRPDPIPPLTHTRVAYFTLIQGTACAIIFGITFTPAEVVFPVLIALVVVLRLSILPRQFSHEELALLDSNIIEHANDKETLGTDGEEEEEKKKISEGIDSAAAVEITEDCNTTAAVPTDGREERKLEEV
jgi:hypothetical protein